MEKLVSTQWLASSLHDNNLVVVDASAHLPAAGRDPRAEFEQGHIPCAVFLDLASLFDPGSPVPNALPTAQQFATRMDSLGITTKDRVVIYDDSFVKTSARAWFMFRMFGHGDVAILDGGLEKWSNENRPLESGQADRGKASGYIPASEKRDNIRTKAQMMDISANGSAQIVDVRDAGRFTGETVDAVHDLPGGHIPGARNLPFFELYNPDGTFRDASSLRQAFDKAGLDLTRPVIASCGGGVTACTALFALETLGHKDGQLYDGSWSEWGADPATPKETGPAR
ncbi:MAG: sulfurtransferase [Sphingomonadaceae bacterium]